MLGLVVLLVAVAVAAGGGAAYRARNGRVRVLSTTGVPATAAPSATAPAAVTASSAAATPDTAELAALRQLVSEPGQRATLLQFSSAFCAPCRATRRTLGEVAAAVPGVRHVEVDAESHLGQVRALDIRRTPTTLVLGPDLQVLARASGAPRRDAVLATLAGTVA